VKDEKIVLTDTELKFDGKANGDKPYTVSIEFFKPVDAEGSTYKVLPRSVQMHILKKDKEEDGFWPQLLKDKSLEKNQIKIDWDRYVDEDEEDEEGGFDMSNLAGGSGMGGGMPGMGGGMPGMDGMMGGMGGGGMGGMDMEALMKQMGAMGGGAGGPGGMDFSNLAGMGGDDDDGDDYDDDGGDDGDLDDLPDLEEAE
jgi:cytosolic prostaglandin-E synthase